MLILRLKRLKEAHMKGGLDRQSIAVLVIGWMVALVISCV
jgi:hypothetical protein